MSVLVAHCSKVRNEEAGATVVQFRIGCFSCCWLMPVLAAQRNKLGDFYAWNACLSHILALAQVRGPFCFALAFSLHILRVHGCAVCPLRPAEGASLAIPWHWRAAVLQSWLFLLHMLHAFLNHILALAQVRSRCCSMLLCLGVACWSQLAGANLLEPTCWSQLAGANLLEPTCSAT
jgi:hypothetical protein